MSDYIYIHIDYYTQHKRCEALGRNLKERPSM